MPRMSNSKIAVDKSQPAEQSRGKGSSPKQRATTEPRSQSKVNKILNNIERSIFRRPFSTPNHGQSNREETSSSSKSPCNTASQSTETRHTKTTSSSCDKHDLKSKKTSTARHSDGESKSSLNVPSLVSSAEKGKEEVSKDQVAASTGFYHKYTRHNNPVSSNSQKSGARNSVDSSGHINAKLDAQLTQSTTSPSIQSKTTPTLTQQTFNKFQQQLVSTLRQNSVQSHHASKSSCNISNKLSIPPPHANEEARSHNQALLFGRSVAESVTSLSVNHQSNKSGAVDPDNLVHSNSASKRNSATSRLIASNVVRPTSATTNARENESQRTCSPASSARSSIVTRLGSQLSGNLRKRCPNSAAIDSNSLTTRTEDEESGFSDFQSRRRPLEQTTTSNRLTGAEAPLVPSTEQISLSTATNTTSSNMISVPNNYWQAQNCASSYSDSLQHLYSSQVPQREAYPQQTVQQQHQYPIIHPQIFHSSQCMMPTNQVPILSPVIRKNLESPLYGSQHQQQQVRVNYFNPTQPQLPSMSLEQPIYGLHSVPSQVKSYMVAGGSEANQQIYANAPPKPRRYQFYNNMIESSNYPIQSTTRAPNAPVMIPIVRSSTGVHPEGLMKPRNQTSTGTNRLSFNNLPAHHNLDPSNDLNIVDSSQISYAPHMSSNGSYILQHDHRLQRQQHQQQQLSFAHFNKSKSSLDSGDLAKLRQNRQMRLPTVARPQAWVPPYGSKIGLSTPISTSLHTGHNISEASVSPKQVPDGSRLQRSKSVTHLLPDYELQTQLDAQARHMWNDSRQVVNNLRHLTTTAASATNLNNVANTIYNSNYNVQYVLDTNATNLNRALSSYNLDQPRNSFISTPVTQPQQKYNQIYSERLFPNATLRRSTTSDWYIRQQPHSMQQNELNLINTMPTTRDDDKALPSSSSLSSNNTSGMFVRQQLQAQKSQTQASTDDSKPSLDDKIRHLVIVNNNREIGGSSAMRLINSHVGVSQSNKLEDHQVYHCSDNATRPVSMSNSYNTTTNSSQHNASLNTTGQRSLAGNQSGFQESKHLTEILSKGNPFVVERNFIGSVENSRGHLQSEEKNKSDMGNRHNRYQINVPPSGREACEESVGSEVINSQLIVDLTTPRVLAKTQTTLSSNQLNMLGTSAQCAQESHSMNQVGLPHLSKSPPQLVNDKNGKHIKSESQNSEHSKSVNFLERTAPYYYSDLKSEEQRQALFNIVQQKSLSPPPQLLSRSADQSSTRLGPKSATLHSRQAKLLSENLMTRQQIPPINQDLNSTNNIARNIDKLFETVDKSKGENIAQSMLTLAGPEELNQRDSKNFSVSTKRSNHKLDATSTRRVTKSKSLDNINQENHIENGTANISNPVYENIRLSNKLMNAINCATEPTSATNSGESMDSILGSSLEDSDSNSDIIDDIKISPTDNHIHDISRLIEQLKMNHSKLSEEYRSTLMRITKTINSKNKQHLNDGSANNEKLARKLDLLEQRSKKYESRSKNQLALIQMMENVLRQSKLRSENANRYTSTNAWPINQETSNIKSESKVAQNSNEFTVTETKKITGKAPTLSPLKGDNSPDQEGSTNQRVDKNPFVDPPSGKSTDAERELYKISPFDERTVDKAATFSVAEKILDIEKRTREATNATGETQALPNNKIPSKSSPPTMNACISPTSNSASSNTNNSLNSITNGFESLRDDDDFVEFYSSDISGHRSNFEASQFSASDYNTSTSASESSTSGLCADSLGSVKNSYKSLSSNKKGAKTENLSINTTDLEPRSQNNLNAQHDKNLQDATSSDRRHSPDIDSIRSGKFTNVLGNVIDVDVCPGNNLSQCSPMQ